jgi:hypothetical protein
VLCSGIVLDPCHQGICWEVDAEVVYATVAYRPIAAKGSVPGIRLSQQGEPIPRSALPRNRATAETEALMRMLIVLAVAVVIAALGFGVKTVFIPRSVDNIIQ